MIKNKFYYWTLTWLSVSYSDSSESSRSDSSWVSIFCFLISAGSIFWTGLLSSRPSESTFFVEIFVSSAASEMSLTSITFSFSSTKGLNFGWPPFRNQELSFENPARKFSGHPEWTQLIFFAAHLETLLLAGRIDPFFLCLFSYLYSTFNLLTNNFKTTY